MNCERLREILSAWLDGELSAQDVEIVESHLNQCEDCRTAAEVSRRQDQELKQAFHWVRAASERLSQSVIQQLPERGHSLDSFQPTSQRAQIASRRRSTLAYWVTLLAAAAACFVLGLSVASQKSKPELNSVVSNDHANSVETEPLVAKLVVATGNLSLRQPRDPDWTSVSERPPVECISKSEFRTGPDVCCELRTTEGCVIRLDKSTEIKLWSPRRIELRKGQIWCLAPDQVVMEVFTVSQEPASNERAVNPTMPTDALQCVCPSGNAEIMAQCRPGDVQVISARGEIQVRTLDDQCRLQTGEVARVSQGKLAANSVPREMLTAERWIYPLLMRKGHRDAELQSRVNDLLANLGRAKMANLYEEELRSLGEYCVLPLAKYVLSPISHDSPAQRQQAARIMTDLAPNWAVPDLIELLNDREAAIRVMAALALQRITSQTFGVAIDDWKSSSQELDSARQKWQQWRDKNLDRLVIPPGWEA